MKHHKSINAPIFVPYDDNNIDHVKNGPDYGQPESRSCWNEMDSLEYSDYVEEIRSKILTHRRIKIVAD